MKIIATADLHGVLPDIPECDLLIIAGDICPDFITERYTGSGIGLTVDKGRKRQIKWLETDFSDWLKHVPARQVVGIAGNHDFAFEQFQLPRNLRWEYMEDSGFEFEGLRLYGIPWVPYLPFWAFPADDQKLEEKYTAIPFDTDILVTHGPPLGYGDLVGPNGYKNIGQHIGTAAANDAIERVMPEAVITGHIHEGYGSYQHSSGPYVYNVAHNTERYEPINPPVEIDLWRARV